MLKKIFLYLMMALYLGAGINHFVNPLWYEKIIPHFFTNSSLINSISGACEIIFALLLIPTNSRRIAAWLIIALLVAVFPANIQMCLDYYHQNNPGFWVTVIRLPIQFVLIWWAHLYTKKTETTVTSPAL